MTNPALLKILEDLRLKQGAEMRIRDEVWGRYWREREIENIIWRADPSGETINVSASVRLPWVPRMEEVIRLLEKTIELKAGSAMVPSIRKAISDLKILLD